MENTMTQQDSKTKALLSCGAIACPLFVLVFMLEGATRANYNPLKHPISSLSIGELGWMQMSNFIITGMLLFAFAIGLRRERRLSGASKSGSNLIGIVAIGLIGAGIFSTDPVYGYPTSRPLALAQFTISGHMHDFFSILVFFCLPSACFVFRRRFITNGETGWAVYSMLSAIGIIATFILAGMGFKQLPGFLEYAGVFQRLSLIIGFTWITLLALHLRGSSKKA
jgi:hypothetical membrane protein